MTVDQDHQKTFERSIALLLLDNGDDAVYVFGECLLCSDYASGDKSVAETGKRLAGILNVPLWQLTLPVPDDEEWCWNDIIDVLIRGGYPEVLPS
ncbi:hypothetical protein [Dryocola sp. LX212]